MVGGSADLGSTSPQLLARSLRGARLAITNGSTTNNSSCIFYHFNSIPDSCSVRLKSLKTLYPFISDHVTAMAPQGDAYNVDWVVSPSSNVHVASDRAWFTDYTPFRTKISAAPGAEPSVEVHGVGTVVLHTRTYGKGNLPSLHVILRLPMSSTYLEIL